MRSSFILFKRDQDQGITLESTSHIFFRISSIGAFVCKKQGQTIRKKRKESEISTSTLEGTNKNVVGSVRYLLWHMTSYKLRNARSSLQITEVIVVRYHGRFTHRHKSRLTTLCLSFFFINVKASARKDIRNKRVFLLSAFCRREGGYDRQDMKAVSIQYRSDWLLDCYFSEISAYFLA